jgi:hypothetical protein
MDLKQMMAACIGTTSAAAQEVPDAWTPISGSWLTLMEIVGPNYIGGRTDLWTVQATSKLSGWCRRRSNQADVYCPPKTPATRPASDVRHASL